MSSGKNGMVGLSPECEPRVMEDLHLHIDEGSGPLSSANFPVGLRLDPKTTTSTMDYSPHDASPTNWILPEDMFNQYQHDFANLDGPNWD